MASFGMERFTDLDFADDAFIFAENMQSLVESLSQESGSLGLRVSWIKAKIQNFLQAVNQVTTITCCGEAVDVIMVFPYLGSQVTPDGLSGMSIVAWVWPGVQCLRWGGRCGAQSTCPGYEGSRSTSG